MKAFLLALACVVSIGGTANAYSVEKIHDHSAALAVPADASVMHTSGTGTQSAYIEGTPIADISPAGFHFLDGTSHDISVSCLAVSGTLSRVISRGFVTTLSSGSLVVLDRSDGKGHGNGLADAKVALAASGRSFSLTVYGVSGKEIDWSCVASSNAVIVRQYVD